MMSRQVKITSHLAVSSAFSLIELLVVIAVISLLLGILTPILSRAKAVARQTVCQSRLRQWGLAFEVYSAENGNYYPHVDGLDRQDYNPGDPLPQRPEDLADHFGWVDVLAPLVGQRPWREHSPRQYPDRDTIFQCPSAKLVAEGLYSYKPRRNGFFSYAMNSCLEFDRNCDSVNGDMPSFLKTSLIKRPYRLVLLFDQLLDPQKSYGGNVLYKEAGENCGSYPRAFSARHPRWEGALGGFILYCDYHVGWESTVWKSEWPVGMMAPPRDDYDWYPY